MKKERTYFKTKLIGKGTYGTVYKAKDEEGREIYALKKIKLQTDDEGIPSTAIREICLLKELTHPNIVKLLDVIHAPKKITLVFEFIDRDLKKVIDSTMGSGLDISTVKSYMYQLLNGMAYIHKYKILHSDLKPQNLLITTEGVLKIADFGLARGYGLPVRNYTHEVVTLWYRAPDVLLGSKGYSTCIDMWSVGCIFEEMVSGKQLFMGKSSVDQLKKIFHIRGTPNERNFPGLDDLPEWEEGKFEKYKEEDIRKYVPKLDDLGVDLLLKMLQIDPDKRISAQDALQHKFFDDVREKMKEFYEEVEKNNIIF